jgi:hypothetical protein
MSRFGLAMRVRSAGDGMTALRASITQKGAEEPTSFEGSLVSVEHERTRVSSVLDETVRVPRRAAGMFILETASSGAGQVVLRDW